MQISTTSTEWVLINPDLAVTIDTTGEIISYEFCCNLDKIGYEQTVIEFTVAVNGELLEPKRWATMVMGFLPTLYWIPLELPAGKHVIQPYWRVRSGTGVSLDYPRVEAREAVTF